MPVRYTPHFASSTAIEPGAVLATDDKGANLYEITGHPHRIDNVVGGRSFLEFDVRVLATGLRGTMTFSVSDVVYLRTTADTD